MFELKRQLWSFRGFREDGDGGDGNSGDHGGDSQGTAGGSRGEGSPGEGGTGGVGDNGSRSVGSGNESPSGSWGDLTGGLSPDAAAAAALANQMNTAEINPSGVATPSLKDLALLAVGLMNPATAPVAIANFAGNLLGPGFGLPGLGYAIKAASSLFGGNPLGAARALAQAGQAGLFGGLGGATGAGGGFTGAGGGKGGINLASLGRLGNMQVQSPMIQSTPNIPNYQGWMSSQQPLVTSQFSPLASGYQMQSISPYYANSISPQAQDLTSLANLGIQGKPPTSDRTAEGVWFG